ncbi:Basic leucine zipper 23 [Hirschfeldia incana]|nr:Basic leucine zipper 23 [Hirschfeldia incana]
MDDGEVEFPLSSSSMDSFFDELLRDSCTHTHTCNPPGPENTHTHTCLHVHTKILPPPQETTDDTTSESSGNKKRPLGNREAVRKYREKKKAKAASLEDEVTRLRAVNSQLMKRLQGQAALEAEVTRLKCLLVDIRGRIEGEIGAFPYQKPNANFSYAMQPCNIPCGGGVDNNSLYCGNSGEGGLMSEQGMNGCEFDQLQCFADESLAGCSNGNGAFGVNASSVANKRKGGTCAAKAV